MTYDIFSGFYTEGDDRKRKTQRSVKNEIQHKAKGCCQKCKKYVGPLGEVHHKDSNRSNDKLSNLQFLCATCHKERTHKQQVKTALKKNKTRTHQSSNPFDISINPINTYVDPFSLPKPIRRQKGYFKF
ncbi:HNH endonuclease [Candidatus Micrarchaeota archaeon]|nr:HNH endonuclease [Candidatus Micrarchaeota archaeon]